MGTEFGGRSSLLFIVGVLSILLLNDWGGASASASLMNMNSSCSSKGDCTFHDIEDEDGEFFIDSEVHRRVLAGATGKKISYASLPIDPVCDAQKYEIELEPEMGIELKRPWLCFTIVVLVILLGTSLQRADCVTKGSNHTSSWCNGSTSECSTSADRDALLVEFQVIEGSLATTITYGSFRPTNPYCNANLYGSCISAQLNQYRRPCDYHNRCQHTPN
ncbi:hypothetical protein RJ639_036791 [Escallonia herrerae]|uniref:Uncharacterized protein n=1 Tax=Escallonia herrerae TaxID=1293975 RepID=A0AA89BD69_9ASTE|nr:hypothetical protein RJ639_036791 [Escallonia herrerae]